MEGGAAMSRSGYSDDCENVGLWRNAVHRAMDGKRGQVFLRELRDALDALPEKRLVTGALVRETGDPHGGGCCTMGAVCLSRGLDVGEVDPDDRHGVAKLFNIAPAMAAEIAFENDEHDYYRQSGETPEERWTRMRAWVEKHIAPTP